MKEAILYSKNPDKSVNCFLCNRLCHIPEGGKGFCGVRKNASGTLYSINYGKAIAVAMDPIEKKPFYHFMPGTRTLSFSTVGCNFRCLYCFTPGTAVINDHEPKFIDELFDEAEDVLRTQDAEIGKVSGRATVSHSGAFRSIRKVFRHYYRGTICSIQPRHAPAIECTPEHGIFVFKDGAISKKPAGELKKGDLLLVPKLGAKGGRNAILDVAALLRGHSALGKKSRKTSSAVLKRIVEMKKSGISSSAVEKIFGLHPTYVRKLWGSLERKGISEDDFFYKIAIMEERGKVHFNGGKDGGIPAKINVDEGVAQLLGYYCAEGSVASLRSRPNSHGLIFSFGLHEAEAAEKTALLLRKKFGVAPIIRRRRTTLCVEAWSSPLALLFRRLCGSGAANKKIPSIISSSPETVIRAFLSAYVEGDGAVMKDSIAANTVSKKLALGIYYLFLRCGYLPSFHVWNPPKKKSIEGRVVSQSTLYYVKLKAKELRQSFISPGLRQAHDPRSRRSLKFWETETHWLVPVFRIAKREYSGYVYNMEVEGEHSYLANFIAAANCQNWDISQQRDNIAGEDIPPKKMAELAEAERADGIAYTYTEPTIFMEYALDTARLAKPKGLFNIFVTNGYMTPAAINEMKPLIDASRIDLKGFNQKIYTDVMGNAKLEAVLQSIKALHKVMHIEIINLVIPGMNDSEDELRALSKWIADVDKNIPVHFIGFYPSYRMMNVPATSLESLRKAREIAFEEGVRYAYTGNRTDVETESTYCYSCKAMLVKRFGFEVTQISIGKDARCPECGKSQYFVTDMERYWKRRQ